MRTYTYTTTISPMDDADLKHNYKAMRHRYWIRRGLWIPEAEDMIVTFERIKKTKLDIGKHPLLGDCRRDKIRIHPMLRHVWVQAHTTLLHEIAHLYIGVSTNWDGRKAKHGKTFQKEIDRLYALGAFRKLI